MRGKIIFVFVIILGLAVSSIYCEEKLDLRLRLVKGQTYKLRTIQDMKINQKIPSQNQKVTIIQKSKVDNTYTIEDVRADGTTVMKVSYDSLFAKTESPNPAESFHYDSSDPANYFGPIASILDAIVGQSFKVIISPDGKLKEIQGADAFFGRIQEKLDELPGGAMNDNIRENLRMEYGEAGIRENMEGFLGMYPDNPVVVGDTWQQRTTLNRGFPMIIDSIYTLKERKDGVATVDLFSMIQTNRDVGPRDIGTAKIDYKVSGTVTGLIYIDETTGWVTSSKQGLMLSGSIAVQSPDMPQPMAVPISLSGNIIQESF